MVRNISLPGFRTLCYPGAKVKYFTTLLPEAISQNTQTDTVIVHVGFNDTKLASSELLKSDSMELIAKMEIPKQASHYKRSHTHDKTWIG
jgi:hypothetical protein